MYEWEDIRGGRRDHKEIRHHQVNAGRQVEFVFMVLCQIQELLHYITSFLFLSCNTN